MRVDPRLGGQLDGQLPAVALDQRLRDHHPRRRRGRHHPIGERQLDDITPDRGDHPRSDDAAPVTQQHGLPRPQPFHRGGVPPFGAVEDA